MRVKLFVKDKSPFSGWRRFTSQLEGDVNAWLAENPGIRIVHVTQSSNGGSFDTSKVWISVWYEEGGYPFTDVAEAVRAAGLPASQGVSKPVRPVDG